MSNTNEETPMSDERDEGLFYIRTWVRGSDRPPHEEQFTNRSEAQKSMNELCADKAYSRIEFLEVREWQTRSFTPRID